MNFTYPLIAYITFLLANIIVGVCVYGKVYTSTVKEIKGDCSTPYFNDEIYSDLRDFGAFIMIVAYTIFTAVIFGHATLVYLAVKKIA